MTAARPKTRRRWMAITLLLAPWVPLFALIMVLRPSFLPEVFRSSVSVNQRWVEAFLLLFLVVYPLGVIVWAYRLQKKLRTERLATAKEHHGLACPYCATPRTLEADEPRCCWRMPQGWRREQYEGYWSLVAANPQAAAAFVRQHAPRSNRLTMALTLAGTSAPILIMQVIGPLSSMTTLILSLPLFGMVLFGAYIAMSNMMHFQAIEPLCAVCGYAKRNDSTCCPECGHDWSALIGGTTLGKSHTNRRRVGLGMLIATPAFFAFLSAPLWLNPILLRMQSPTSLIAQSTSDNLMMRVRVWREINRRTLTPSEESQLADHLLAARSSTLTEPSAQVFLAGYFASTKPTAAQRREALVGAAVPALITPIRVKAGEDFNVSLRLSTRTEAMPLGQLTLVSIADVWFEDEPEIRWHPVNRIPQATNLFDPRFNKSAVPSITLNTDRRGERTLVMRIWYVGGPPTIPTTMAWVSDPAAGMDRPVVPTGAMGPELVELRRIILVK
jgi:hypothetical protein